MGAHNDIQILDVLLLHRPDTLMDPAEVAEAFTELHQAGKVRAFGVSNQNSLQMELLQKYCPFKLGINQLQFGLGHTPLIDAGIAANMTIDQATHRTGEFLEYARLNDITIQAWSPFQYGYFEGLIFNNKEKYGKLNEVIDELHADIGELNAINAARMNKRLTVIGILVAVVIILAGVIVNLFLKISKLKEEGIFEEEDEENEADEVEDEDEVEETVEEKEETVVKEVSQPKRMEFPEEDDLEILDLDLDDL